MLALCSAAASFGCTYGANASLAGAGGESDPERVVILGGPLPRRPHTVVGVVAAQSDGEAAEDVEEELKVQAARLGADAVVLSEFTFGVGQWSAALRASGVAIRYDR
jgi:hypothetical protein